MLVGRFEWLKFVDLQTRRFLAAGETFYANLGTAKGGLSRADYRGLMRREVMLSSFLVLIVKLNEMLNSNIFREALVP